MIFSAYFLLVLVEDNAFAIDPDVEECACKRDHAKQRQSNLPGMHTYIARSVRQTSRTRPSTSIPTLSTLLPSDAAFLIIPPRQACALKSNCTTTKSEHCHLHGDLPAIKNNNTNKYPNARHALAKRCCFSGYPYMQGMRTQEQS